jgi:hypothetical protein
MDYCLETHLEQVFVTDLKLLVLRGIPRWIPETDYQRSIVLRELIRRGDITFSRRQRSRVSKPPQKARVHSARMSRPSKEQRRLPPVESVEMTPEQLQALLHKTAQDAAQGAVKALLPTLNAVLANQQVKPDPVEVAPAPDMADLEDRVGRAVEKALGGALVHRVSGSPSGTTGALGPADPLFIPTGIVSQDPSDVISVQSKASESGSLGDAAEALRKLRKEKKS